ncbi:MAG: hypothetical protein U1U88_001196 [Lawsonella clevelandensis]
MPGVNRVVGDFTSLTPVACRVLPGDSLEEVARAVQQTLASVRDYDAAGALWVQRELLQLTGDPYASMLPVVFTCGLGLVADGVSTTDFSFGTLGRVRSQTPQTLLDLQVHEDVKGLHLTADYVTQALDAQRVQDAISAVAQRICDCTERVHGAQAVAAGAAALDNHPRRPASDVPRRQPGDSPSRPAHRGHRPCHSCLPPPTSPARPQTSTRRSPPSGRPPWRVSLSPSTATSLKRVGTPCAPPW